MMTNRGIRLVLLVAMLAALATVAPRARADTVVIADTDASALVVFNQELDSYGVWVQTADHGLVWVPHAWAVGDDFKPYVTNGHWAVAEDGDWMWVSDYPFGWVVFHYGRWTWSSTHGWVWVPGREYSPAWVVWRVPQPGYTYVGWAPAPPAYYWVDGVAVSVWVTPYTPWVYCHSDYVFSYHVYHHIYHDHSHLYHAHRVTTPYHPVDARRRAPTAERAAVPATRVPRVRTRANPRAVALASRQPAGVEGRMPARPTAVQSRETTSRSAVSRPIERSANRTPVVAGRTAARPRLDHTVTLPRGDSRTDLDLGSGTRSLEPARPVSLAPARSVAPPVVGAQRATPRRATTTGRSPAVPYTNQARPSGTTSRSSGTSTSSRSTQAAPRRSSSSARPTATPRSTTRSPAVPRSPSTTGSGSRSSGGMRAPTPRRTPASRRR